ncbi:MAG: type III-A CRISPR-associated protein Csm2 [Hydrogenobacter sp.]
MNGRHQQQGRPQQGQQGKRDDEYPFTNELISKLKTEHITNIKGRNIFHPDGYAKNIVEELELKGVQLRRFYMELKNIQEIMKSYEKDKSKEDGDVDSGNKKDVDIDYVKYRLYKLYAIINYQAKRKVIKPEFAELLTVILDNIERQNFDKTAVDRAVDLLMAMVAYSKEDDKDKGG